MWDSLFLRMNAAEQWLLWNEESETHYEIEESERIREKKTTETTLIEYSKQLIFESPLSVCIDLFFYN